jgi:hypothetical protein
VGVLYLKRNRIISFFLFFVLLLGLFVWPLQVESVSYTETFEDYLDGDQVSESWFYTWSETASYSVNDMGAGNGHSGQFAYIIGKNAGEANAKTYWNYTNVTFSHHSVWAQYTGAYGTNYVGCYFRNATEDSLFGWYISGSGNGDIYYYSSALGWTDTGEEINGTSEWCKITVENTASNLVELSLTWDSDTEFYSTTVGIPDYWVNVTQCYWIGGDAGHGESCYANFDDHYISLGGYTEDDEYDSNFNITLKIFDGDTNTQLNMASVFAPYPTWYPSINTDRIHTDPYLDGSRVCDLGYDYCPCSSCPGCMYGPEFQIKNIPYNYDGSYIWLNFTQGFGLDVNGDTKSWNAKNIYMQIFPEQSYDIFFYGTEPVEYYQNGRCDFHDLFRDTNGDPILYCIYTNKQRYAYGEPIYIAYRGKDCDELSIGDVGIWIWNDSSPTLPDHGENCIKLYGSPDNPFSDDTNTLILNGEDQYLIWDSNDSNYWPPKYGSQRYEINMCQGWFFLWYFDLFLLNNNVVFYVDDEPFNPEGNIISVSPSNPYLGQRTTITFNATSRGKLYYKNLYDPTGGRHLITEFYYIDDPPGTNLQVNHTFWDPGLYQLELECFTGFDYTIEDTELVNVGWINENDTGYGYNVEFLEVEPAHVVAGYDLVKIAYKTLVDGTIIKIMDPRGQNTRYSTMVSAGFGLHNFTLPNYASIGTWRVEMWGDNKSYSNFSVVADENNWIEFSREVYGDQDQFSVHIMHDKKVGLVFLKNNKTVGQILYLEPSQSQNIIIPIPPSNADPSIGDWKVKMYEVNNYVKIRLLAADECRVIAGTANTDIQQEGYTDFFSILALGGEFFGGGSFGLAFLSILFIIVLMYVLSKAKLDQRNIFYVCIALTLFFTFIGWLPIYITLIMIVLTGLLFGVFSTKKLMGVGGGDS